MWVPTFPCSAPLLRALIAQRQLFTRHGTYTRPAESGSKPQAQVRPRSLGACTPPSRAVDEQTVAQRFMFLSQGDEFLEEVLFRSAARYVCGRRVALVALDRFGCCLCGCFDPYEQTCIPLLGRLHRGQLRKRLANLGVMLPKKLAVAATELTN